MAYARQHVPSATSQTAICAHAHICSPMSRNSSSACMAASSLQRQAAMSGDPQSTAAPSALTGMRARPSASRATPPQRSAGAASATGSLAGGGSGTDSFGSFSHALRKPQTVLVEEQLMTLILTEHAHARAQSATLPEARNGQSNACLNRPCDARIGSIRED